MSKNYFIVPWGFIQLVFIYICWYLVIAGEKSGQTLHQNL